MTQTRGKYVYLLLLFVCIGWGSTWVVSKIGVSNMPPLQLAAMRQFFGGLLFCLFFFAKKHPLPTKKQWPVILILAVLNFILSNSLSTWGVHFISPGLGAIIGAIFPLWLVIIYFFRGKPVKTAAVIGMLIGFSGICIIFYEHLGDFLNPGFRFGIVISVLSTLWLYVHTGTYFWIQSLFWIRDPDVFIGNHTLFYRLCKSSNNTHQRNTGYFMESHCLSGHCRFGINLFCLYLCA